MKITSFRDLTVWQTSMKLVEDIYLLAGKLPADEKYGLSVQLKKAAISIPSNIAEGSGYGTNRQYVHHLRVALGSEAEVQTQLEIALRLRFVSAADIKPALERASQVGRMINGLLRSLAASDDT